MSGCGRNNKARRKAHGHGSEGRRAWQRQCFRRGIHCGADPEGKGMTPREEGLLRREGATPVGQGRERGERGEREPCNLRHSQASRGLGCQGSV